MLWPQPLSSHSSDPSHVAATASLLTFQGLLRFCGRSLAARIPRTPPILRPRLPSLHSGTLPMWRPQRLCAHPGRFLRSCVPRDCARILGFGSDQKHTMRPQGPCLQYKCLCPIWSQQSCAHSSGLCLYCGPSGPARVPAAPAYLAAQPFSAFIRC